MKTLMSSLLNIFHKIAKHAIYFVKANEFKNNILSSEWNKTFRHILEERDLAIYMAVAGTLGFNVEELERTCPPESHTSKPVLFESEYGKQIYLSSLKLITSFMHSPHSNTVITIVVGILNEKNMFGSRFSTREFYITLVIFVKRFKIKKKLLGYSLTTWIGSAVHCLTLFHVWAVLSHGICVDT